MRKYIILAVAGLTACACLAQPRWVPYEVSYGATHTNVLTETKNPGGYVDEVYVVYPAGSVTADVSVISTPAVGSGLTATVLYTNSAMTASAVARPRVPQQAITGTNYTSLTVRERYLCAGDAVVFRVDQTSAVTGITFRAWLKLDS